MRKVFVIAALGLVISPPHAQSQAPAPAGANAPPVATAPPTNTGGGAQRRPPSTGTVPRLPDGTVDLTGAWQGGGPVEDLEAQGGLKRGEIPLLPIAKQLMDARARIPSDDPHNFCMPMGVPRSTPFPFRFVQNYTHRKPTHLFIVYEGNIHSYRQIFMDGRKHPAELDPTWYGHSIGWWEKDALVIDTVGYNDKFWFDRRGHPHTEQLHTIERWTRLDFGHMENKVTIDDPGAYSKPFTVTFMATLQEGEELLEYICQENNQFGVAGEYSNPFQIPTR